LGLLAKSVDIVTNKIYVVMKKNIIILLLFSCMLTSCFSTRYVSEQSELVKEYMNADVDDIEFEFGKPHETDELRNGYAYTYFYEGKTQRSRKPVEQHIRFSFNNDGYVRNIQSTTTVMRRKFNAGDTVFACIMGFVVIPGVIIFAATVSSD
jgi:hypothetical protein